MKKNVCFVVARLAVTILTFAALLAPFMAPLSKANTSGLYEQIISKVYEKYTPEEIEAATNTKDFATLDEVPEGVRWMWEYIKQRFADEENVAKQGTNVKPLTEKELDEVRFSRNVFVFACDDTSFGAIGGDKAQDLVDLLQFTGDAMYCVTVGDQAVCLLTGSVLEWEKHKIGDSLEIVYYMDMPSDEFLSYYTNTMNPLNEAIFLKDERLILNKDGMAYYNSGVQEWSFEQVAKAKWVMPGMRSYPKDMTREDLFRAMDELYGTERYAGGIVTLGSCMSKTGSNNEKVLRHTRIILALTIPHGSSPVYGSVSGWVRLLVPELLYISSSIQKSAGSHTRDAG